MVRACPLEGDNSIEQEGKVMSDDRQLRVLKYPWHTAHDYELSKLGFSIDLISLTHRNWETEKRRIPDNVRARLDPRCPTADMMILHLDQWSYHQLDKRYLFEHYRNSFAGPKVIINHGCNMMDGCSSEEMRELTRGLPVVCNSPTAHRLWSLPNSVFIRHGMSPEEWPESHYGRHAIVVCQPNVGLHDECRNGAAVIAFEARTGIKVEWLGRDRVLRSFDRYVAFLGSTSIFFNPSFASANPRSRTEAMLCGLAVVTTNSNGEDEYIVNGENGFASNDMNELYGYLEFLYANP